MPTFKITVAYDGTELVGWQRQASGISVQGCLEDALHDLDRREVTVVGAGRTDAGVHALGQVASFALARSMTPDALIGALNGRLPSTVRVLTAERVSDSFHARFAATRKTYRYRIWNAEVLSPFERHYSWHVVPALDRDRMAAAAKMLEGHHDFAAFQSAGSSTRSTDREVFSSQIGCLDSPLIIYEVSGDGFLRHMVRTIVGTLVEIGRGRHRPDWMRELLAGRDRTKAGATAPACGLVLVTVEYGGQLLATDRENLLQSTFTFKDA
jgi:tRNA pseudouridine38-40 synthase